MKYQWFEVKVYMFKIEFSFISLFLTSAHTYTQCSYFYTLFPKKL